MSANSRNAMGKIGTALVAGAMLVAAQSAMASGNNNAAPAGAILDLGGGETGTVAQAVNHGTTLVPESVSFTAAIASTDITFAFREDPNYISFTNVSLIDNTTSSGNLLVNGDFSGGSYADPVSATDPLGNSSVPNGWSYANIYGAGAQGELSGTTWVDGSIQAYDALDQVVATHVGDTYTLSFEYTDGGTLTTFSDLSTNGNTTSSGGNGIDILAYAQAGLPPACPPGTVCTNPTNPSVPEPATLALLGLGLAGLGFGRRRASKV